MPVQVSKLRTRLGHPVNYLVSINVLGFVEGIQASEQDLKC